MSLLILGGTADGRKLASHLYQQGLPVIYSVAGLVRKPDLDCPVVSGGFSQFGGLGEYIKQNVVKVILDATHPYAEKMSNTAVRTAGEAGIPCWRFHRPAWKRKEGDCWFSVKSWAELFKSLIDYKSVFLTCGQLTQSQVDDFKLYKQQRQLLRTAVKPKVGIIRSMCWMKALGPFSLEEEILTMSKYKIDVLVSKNSGGDATSAKLSAARKAGIPVYMLERPGLLPADNEFSHLDECKHYVQENYLYSERNT